MKMSEEKLIIECAQGADSSKQMSPWFCVCFPYATSVVPNRFPIEVHADGKGLRAQVPSLCVARSIPGISR